MLKEDEEGKIEMVVVVGLIDSIRETGEKQNRRGRWVGLCISI